MHCVLLIHKYSNAVGRSLDLRKLRPLKDCHGEQQWLQNLGKWWAGRHKTGALLDVSDCPARGCVCSSSCVGLQTGTTGAEDPANVAKGIWLRISSGLIPDWLCTNFSGVSSCPVSRHNKIPIHTGWKFTVWSKKHSIKREPSEAACRSELTAYHRYIQRLLFHVVP